MITTKTFKNIPFDWVPFLQFIPREIDWRSSSTEKEK